LGGDRSASVSRELTKRFETTYTGTLAQLSEIAEKNADMSRGEIVIVVSGNPNEASAAQSLNADQLLRALLDELSPSQAAKVAAKLSGEKRSDLYARAMQLSGGKREE
jgi:16S rRNA (cytidine1402-2'-O)-methyltransferase